MKLKVLVVDLEFAPNQRKVLWRAGLTTIILLAGAGAALAAFPTPQYETGNLLTAASLNSNFGALESRIAAIESPVRLRYTHEGHLAIAQNGDVVVTGWTKDFDSASAFEATGGVFTAPLAGTYLVEATIAWAAASTSAITHRLFISGNSIGQNFLSWSLGDVRTDVPLLQHGSYLTKLAKGDTIYLQVFTDEPVAGDRIIGNDHRANYLQIVRLGD